jgi:putative NADH-flavin reductase
MKVTVFGATGGTGVEVVRQLLDNDYSVVAFVRDESKLGDLRDQVEVVKGDAMNSEDVEKAVKQGDAVISAIGPTKNSPKGMQPQATENIITAMKKHGKKRLITMTGGGVRWEEDRPRFADKAIKGIMMVIARKPLKDGEEHAEIVKKSGLDWTIVRGPMLTDDEATGEYTVGRLGDEGIGTKISRKDIAEFIVSTLESDEWLHKMPIATW